MLFVFPLCLVFPLNLDIHTLLYFPLYLLFSQIRYNQEKTNKWAAVDKCPLNCGPPGNGQCNKGDSSCTCAYSGIVGRQCTGCAPVMVRGNFTDSQGTARSKTAMLKCNGEMTTMWMGEGGLCFQQHPHCQCTIAGSSISCNRNSIGNLRAEMSTGACTCWYRAPDSTLNSHTCGMGDPLISPAANTTNIETAGVTVNSGGWMGTCEFF